MRVVPPRRRSAAAWLVYTAARVEEAAELRSPVVAGPCSLEEVPEVLAAGGEERLPRGGRAREASRWRVGGAKRQNVQGCVGDLLVGLGKRDPASGLAGGQLVLEDVCILLLWSRILDPLRRRSIECASTRA